MIFQLHKPLYDWHNFAHPDDPADFDLRLNPVVKEWLDQRNIKYDDYALHEQRDLGEGLHTYLIFYIDIWDDNSAMLFKLTWM